MALPDELLPAAVVLPAGRVLSTGEVLPGALRTGALRGNTLLRAARLG
ncbi:MAG: hypothetical protein KDA37_16120 [Planctomycetales bacterium]|nr:hypothetical protein [Planctomycetales bacterium]